MKMNEIQAQVQAELKTPHLDGEQNGKAATQEVSAPVFPEETLNKSPRTSCRHIFRLILSQNLEIHKVFLRFLAFIRRKICSAICALRFNHRFPEFPDVHIRLIFAKERNPVVPKQVREILKQSYLQRNAVS